MFIHHEAWKKSKPPDDTIFYDRVHLSKKIVLKLGKKILMSLNMPSSGFLVRSKGF